MCVNFKIHTFFTRGIDSSSLPLDDQSRVIAEASSHYLGGKRGVYWFSLRRCGESWYTRLEVSDGALECTNVSKRSSYKGLFFVCLMDL